MTQKALTITWLKMTLKSPVNANYAATVIKIKEIHPLDGCDNVAGTSIFGSQAIVGKDTRVGDTGIVFPAECALSEEYARENNLHRHGDLNRGEGATGYLEDNRRVKAMKFRGHRSDALFMPLSSLDYLDEDLTTLQEGDTFDEIGGREICKKYEVPRQHSSNPVSGGAAKTTRIDKLFMPEHYDTDNYFRNEHGISDDTRIVVTQKLHGTSIRVGNTVVSRKLTLRDKIARRLGVRVAETDYDYVFGSRKVIKDVNNPDQNHFYSTDIWTEYGQKLDGLLPQGFIAYGELIGHTPEGSPIQKNFTYNAPANTAGLLIYRIAYINPQGVIVDLAWEQVKEFCRDAGLIHVPELWSGTKGNFDVAPYLDVKFEEKGFDAVPLSPESPCDEGVCIRVDGLAPYILKAKSPMFLAHETKMLDEEATDIETEGTTDEVAQTTT